LSKKNIHVKIPLLVNLPVKEFYMSEQTEQYAKQIDEFLNAIRLVSENQREVLLGADGQKITATQGHLLMLLSQKGPQTNSVLAHEIGVTPAAVTKAMKGLQEGADPKVTPMPDENDGRVMRWTLTNVGMSLAASHATQHRETLAEYEKVIAAFSPENQLAIGHFLMLIRDRFISEK
jgi:DNA-binding MarR family transcriptional regulator